MLSGLVWYACDVLPQGQGQGSGGVEGNAEGEQGEKYSVRLDEAFTRVEIKKEWKDNG